MRMILFLGVLLALLWVGWNKVQEIQAVGAADGSALDLGLPSESPSASRFDEQYLCMDLSGHDWKMFPSPGDSYASDCTGPYIDSRNLCLAMKRQEIDSVEIYGQGRVLRCD